MENDYLAYFKLKGKSVEGGYLDARKSAEVLLGIDEALRFFLSRKVPEFAKVEFEIPVRIRKGSWEALIPQDIWDWVTLIAGTGTSTYVITALKEMAKNDVGDKGLKDLFKFSVKGIKWAINISKHLKTTVKKKFEKTKVKDEDGVIFIGIQNEEGEVLYVPKIFLELFTQIPAHLFSKIAKIVDEEREFLVDFIEEEKNDVDDYIGHASITKHDKNIFYEEKDDDVLFPELMHGSYVELEGHVTRGNKSSNSIGFEYNGHILTCHPKKGNIIKDKDLLFTDCVIKGHVDRLDSTGKFIEKRPRIIYNQLIPLDNLKSPSLFDG